MKKSFSFKELREEARANAVNLYYADADYQAFIEAKAVEFPEEVMMLSDFAAKMGWRFDEHGERIG